MSVEYKGMILFPITNEISMQMMYFETSHASTESSYTGLINPELNALLVSMGYREGSVCSVRKTNNFYACNFNYHNVDMDLYWFSYGPSNNPQYLCNVSNSAYGAFTFEQSKGTPYLTEAYLHVLVKTSDDKYCLGTTHSVLNSQQSEYDDNISVTLQPAGSAFGYARIEGLTPNASVNTYNGTNVLIRIHNYLSSNPPQPVPPEHTDPYTPGGPTGPGGGDGIGPSGIINDDIDFPTPLAISASNANFISIWTPTLDQVQTLAKWMWTTDPLKWEFWQKLLQNPLDLIFSLTIMPVPIYHPDEGGTPVEGELVAQTDPLSLGWQDTGIRMDWVPEQYVTIDMGTINLEEVWGAFLDYEPYTKIDIFLPYIGTKQLDTNDCMPRSISLRYIIDLATGTCVALIKCDNSVYYHFSGNCASQIPITVNQCQEIVRGLMTMAVGAATFALGGPMGAGAHASKAAIAKGAAMKAGGAAMVGSGADSAAKGVNVSRSGVIGAAAGLMDVQTPYLIISRPRQAVPEDQNKYTGYPSFITEQIGDLTGYTEVQMIHLHNMSCTDEEYKEIDSLLTQGVII